MTPAAQRPRVQAQRNPAPPIASMIVVMTGSQPRTRPPARPDARRRPGLPQLGRTGRSPRSSATAGADAEGEEMLALAHPNPHRTGGERGRSHDDATVGDHTEKTGEGWYGNVLEEHRMDTVRADHHIGFVALAVAEREHGALINLAEPSAAVPGPDRPTGRLSAAGRAGPRGASRSAGWNGRTGRAMGDGLPASPAQTAVGQRHAQPRDPGAEPQPVEHAKLWA